MGAVADSKVANIGRKREVAPGQLYIYGKISAIEKFKSKKERRDLYRCRVLMKDASDEFSFPMPFDVVCEEPLGELGSIYEGVVNAKTFRKDYNTKPDSETGETKKISQVELTCRV